MDRFQVYKDIEARTNGEIYIGVVGPVRTGKSTFIKRFMDVLVLPEMEDEHARMRTQDELPQSASGRTIMTTEPKFVPKEAAKIRLADDVDVKVRLIDCVGYMVEGAAGYMDGDSQRQVKTPWFAYEIPFAKAAGIGTRKVIHDHSNCDYDRRYHHRYSKRKLQRCGAYDDTGIKWNRKAVHCTCEFKRATGRTGAEHREESGTGIWSTGATGQL